MEKFKMSGKTIFCRECLPGAYGHVIRVFIKKLNRHVYVCDECEIVWETIEDLNCNKFVYLDNFTHKNGLKESWQDFSEVNSEWYTEEELDI
ncbi:hypothetical protein ACR6HW_02215 [Fusibacter sp. JL298sf-3]